MKAMIWKEWRENAKWAALMFLALTLGVLYFTHNTGVNEYRTEPFSPIVDYANLTLFLLPICATALGVLQVASELKRDQWAFLMHRPVSRSVIFGGKVAAGLGLYLAATLLPLLLLGVWLSLPGSVPAPFDWRMLLGPFINVLAGMPFFFAGMLTAVRPARWYGSKALGLVAAILGLAIATTVPELWHAFLAVALSSALLGTAAWGSFLTTGTYDRQPRPAKIALGLSLYIGLVTTVGGVTLFLSQAVSERENAGRVSSIVRSRAEYVVTPKGQIVRLRYNGDGELSEVTDLQGHRLPLPPQNQRYNQPASFLLGYNGGGFNATIGYRQPERYVNNLFVPYYAISGEELAYWVPSRRQVVLYNKETRREAGTFGPNGFAPLGAAAASRFTEDLVQWQNLNYRGNDYILPFDHAIFALDVRQRRLTRLFESPDSTAIRGVAALEEYVTPVSGRDFDVLQSRVVALVAGDKVHFVTTKGKALFSTPIEKTNKKFALLAATSDDRKKFFLWYQIGRDALSPNEGFVAEFSSRGERLAKHDLPSLEKFNTWATTEPYWHERAATVLEVPPTFMAVGTVLSARDAQANPSAATASNRAQVQRSFMGTLWLTLLYMPLTYLAARRAALGKRTVWMWTLAALPLGLSGLLLLLALHDWPVLVDCLRCGKKRSIENENCEHCGAAFPVPQQDDTSIFEDRLREVDVEKLLERV